jgi:hypothetical protein
MVLSMLVELEHRDSTKSKKCCQFCLSGESSLLLCDLSSGDLWGLQADVTEQARVKPRELAQASAVPSLMLQQHPNGLQGAHDTEVWRL